MFRYRSRADFDENDVRLNFPRFSEENFPKNLALTDKIKAIADKYKATPSQITLAWILATSENCQSRNYLSSLTLCRLFT